MVQSNSQVYRVNPTVLLFLGTQLGFFGVVSLGFIWDPSSIHPLFKSLLFVFQVLLIVIAFTPLHESTHKIASKKHWLNEFILIGNSPMFVTNSLLFRYVHIRHHAHTNDPELDPDHFTAGKTLFERWVRSFLLLFSYYGYGFKFLWEYHKKHPSSLILAFSCPIAVFVFGALTGHLEWVLISWMLPSFIGTGILGFINTALPHHPGKNRERMKNTRNFYVPRWLQWVMLNQNLHLVHHLRPDLPWYKYVDFWKANCEKLLAQGAEVSVFTKRSDPFSP